MPYSSTWIIPDAVFYIRTYGVVEVEELRQIIADVDEQTNRIANRLLHVVIDNSDMERANVSLADIMEVMRPLSKDQVMTGWSVTINPNMVQRMLATILVQMRGIRERQCRSAAEATRFLAENSENLPSSEELLALYNQARARLIKQIETENPAN